MGKVLLGLPFHGVMMEKDAADPKGNVVDSSTFAGLLNNQAELTWDKTECEHQVEVFHNNKEFITLYPTKKVDYILFYLYV